MNGGEAQSQEPRELTSQEIERLIGRVNEHFYRASPHMYFHQRSLHLFLTAAEPERLQSAIGEGISLGELKLTPAAVDESHLPPTADEEMRQQYLAIESTALLHHAAESLLRLYLAHEGHPQCPWIGMTLLTYDFKSRLETRFPKDGPREDDQALLFPVFYPGRSRSDIAFDNDDLNPDLNNISRFLHHFARIHLDEAPIYNSAKHGLGVVGGEVGFAMEDAFDWRSLSLVAPVTQGGKPKSLLFRSVDVERDLTFTHVAVELIRQLWAVAKARYVGEDLGPMNLFVAPLFRDVLMCRKTFSIDHLNLPLSMWAAPASAREPDNMAEDRGAQEEVDPTE